MTRKEEIRKAASEYIVNNSIDEYIQISDCKDSFIEGAKWADNHPKSPWINVEEDLPFNHKELLYDTESSIFPYTKPVLIRTKENAHELSYMYVHEYRWNWDYDLDEITHWMPIPELPKE